MAAVLPPVKAAGRRLKRYQLAARGLTVTASAQSSADAELGVLCPEPDGTPPTGFAILHAAPTGLWLNVYSWVSDYVLHFQAARSDLTGTPAFAALERPWIGCVWELALVEHERAAWVRHMLVPRVPDLAGYLADARPAGLVDA